MMAGGETSLNFNMFDFHASCLNVIEFRHNKN